MMPMRRGPNMMRRHPWITTLFAWGAWGQVAGLHSLRVTLATVGLVTFFTWLDAS